MNALKARDAHDTDTAATRAQAALRRLLVDADGAYLDGMHDAAHQALGLLGDPLVIEVDWDAFSAGLPAHADAYRDAVADYFQIFADLCAAVRAERASAVAR